MQDGGFQYDMALSFVSADRGLATDLYELLSSHWSVYVDGLAHAAKEQQIENEAGDPVLEWQSRAVVVLHREEWSTAVEYEVEREAIHHRGEGRSYRFMMCVPLDGAEYVPSWIPHGRIWLGFEQWGTSGAAAVIDAHIQQLGGAAARTRSPDRLRMLERAIEREQARRQFLDSESGVKAAMVAVSSLQSSLRDMVRASHPEDIGIRTDRRETVLTADDYSLLVDWRATYVNTLEESYLSVKLWRGHPVGRDKSRWSGCKIQRKLEFVFDQSSSGTRGWREVRQSDLMSSTAIAQLCVQLLLQHRGQA